MHQAVAIWEQLTGITSDAQIEIPANKPYTLNMGGDDVSVVADVNRKAQIFKTIRVDRWLSIPKVFKSIIVETELIALSLHKPLHKKYHYDENFG